MFKGKSTWTDLIEKGILVQGILTIAVVGVALYMYATGKPVPDSLVQWAGLLLGLYGGTALYNRKKGSDA